jgi:SseB protein N-terminal domain
MFEPVNALETLMQSAALNPAKIPDFYRALLDRELYILTPETELEPGRRRSLKLHETISVATVEFKGKTWHPAFTAPERVSAYLKEPETCLEAKARDLFVLLPPGSNSWLNPQSECQKPLPSDEISLLLSGKIFTMDFTGRGGHSRLT